MDFIDEVEHQRDYMKDLAASSVRLPKEVSEFLFDKLQGRAADGLLHLEEALPRHPGMNIPESVKTYGDARDILLRSAIPQIHDFALKEISRADDPRIYGDAFNTAFQHLTEIVSSRNEEGLTFSGALDRSFNQSSIENRKSSRLASRERPLTEDMSYFPPSMFSDPRVQDIAARNRETVGIVASNMWMGTGEGKTHVRDMSFPELVESYLTTENGSTRPTNIYTPTGDLYVNGERQPYVLGPRDGWKQVSIGAENVTDVINYWSASRGKPRAVFQEEIFQQYSNEKFGGRLGVMSRSLEGVNAAELEVQYDQKRDLFMERAGMATPGKVGPRPQVGWGASPYSNNDPERFWGRKAGDSDSAFSPGIELEWGERDIKATINSIRSGKYSDWIIGRTDKGKLRAEPGSLNSSELLTDDQVDAFERFLYHKLETTGGSGSMPRLFYGAYGDIANMSDAGDEVTVNASVLGKGKVKVAYGAFTGAGVQSEVFAQAQAIEEFRRDTKTITQAMNASEPDPLAAFDQPSPAGKVAALKARMAADQVKAAEAFDKAPEAGDPATAQELAETDGRVMHLFTAEGNMAKKKLSINIDNEKAAADASAITNSDAFAQLRAQAAAIREDKSRGIFDDSIPSASKVIEASGSSASTGDAVSGISRDAVDNNVKQWVDAGKRQGPPSTGQAAGPVADAVANSREQYRRGMSGWDSTSIESMGRDMAHDIGPHDFFEENPLGSRRFVRGKNGALGVQYADKDGNVTISEGVTKQALEGAKTAIQYAFDKGAANLSAEELPATLIKYAGEYLRKVFSSTSHEGAQMQSLATGLVREYSAKLSDKLGNGDSSAGSRSSLYASGVARDLKSPEDVASAMSEDPGLAARAEALGMTPEAMFQSGAVFRGDGGYYDMGGGGFGSGGMSGRGVGGYRGGQRGRDGLRSPYQEDIGRVMQSLFMAGLVWNSTGGQYVEAANAYAGGQADAMSAYTFGGGGPGGSAAAYPSMASFSADRLGRVAWDQWGSILQAGTRLTNNEGLLNAGMAGVSGIGAGLIAGFGTSQLGGWITGIGASGIFGSSSIGIAGAGATIAGAALPVGLGVGVVTAGYLGYQGNRSAALEHAAMGEDVSPLSYTMASLFNGGVNDFVSGTPTQEQMRASLLAGKSEVEIAALRTQGLIDRTADSVSDLGYNANEAKAMIGQLSQFIGGDSSDTTAYAGLIMRGAAKQGQGVMQLAQDISGVASGRGYLRGTSEWRYLAAQMSDLSLTDLQEFSVAEGQQAQLNSSWARNLNTENWTRTAYDINQTVFGGHMTAGQSSAMSSLLGRASVAGVNVDGNMGMSYAGMVASLGSIGAMGAGDAGMALAGYGTTSAQQGSFFNQGASFYNSAQLAGLPPAMLNQMLGGNQMALSNLSAFTGTGYQFFDQSGVRAGVLTGGNAIMNYAQAIGMPSNSNYNQVLDQAGFSANPEARKAYIEGGSMGLSQYYSDKLYQNQLASIGIGFARINQQQNYLWGADQGGTWENPTAGSSWGIQNRQIAVQWEGTQAQQQHSLASEAAQISYTRQSQGIQYQQYQTNLSQQYWSAGFGYQTSLMQREQSRENYAFGMQMDQMQFGWGIQDIDEQIRRSSGYQRALLERQRGRMTTAQNLEVQHKEEVQDTQEKLWSRQDEEYRKQISHMQEIQKLEEKNYTLMRSHTEEMYDLGHKELLRQIAETKELHELQMEQLRLDRENQQKNIEFQKASLGIQAESARIQKEQSDNQRATQKMQETSQGAWSKIVSDAGATAKYVQTMVNALNGLRVSVSVGPKGITISGSGTNNTIK